MSSLLIICNIPSYIYIYIYIYVCVLSVISIKFCSNMPICYNYKARIDFFELSCPLANRLEIHFLNKFSSDPKLSVIFKLAIFHLYDKQCLFSKADCYFVLSR